MAVDTVKRERRYDQTATADSTDFGFQDVPWQDKARRVRARVRFGRRSLRPDERSDVGRRAPALEAASRCQLTGLRPGGRALDVAGGTGDLAAGLARQVGASGLVVLADINASMLQHGRDRLIDQALVSRRARTCRPMPSACRSPMAASIA